MRLFGFVLTLCLAAPFPVMAATGGSPLLASADREARRIATPAAAPADRHQADGQPARSSPWISRHPVLFGTLVGAGGGSIASFAMENELFCSGGDEDCLFYGRNRAVMGAAVGAGVGALVGWIAGAARADRRSAGPRRVS